METELIPQTFVDFLIMIGEPAFIGVFVSLLLKEWVWLAKQSTGLKWSLVGVITLILPFISRLLLTFLPLDVIAFIEQWYPTLLVGIGVWTTSQIWHEKFNRQLPRTTSVFSDKKG